MNRQFERGGGEQSAIADCWRKAYQIKRNHKPLTAIGNRNVEMEWELPQKWNWLTERVWEGTILRRRTRRAAEKRQTQWAGGWHYSLLYRRGDNSKRWNEALNQMEMWKTKMNWNWREVASAHVNGGMGGRKDKIVEMRNERGIREDNPAIRESNTKERKRKRQRRDDTGHLGHSHLHLLQQFILVFLSCPTILSHSVILFVNTRLNALSLFSAMLI